MQGKGARTLAPNGAKIRALRAESGTSQKELLRGSTVGLRTYQRAEQGLPISGATLREIAGLLKVPLTEITLASEEESETAGAVRLRACDGAGGLDLLDELQKGMIADLRVDFDVDPYGDEATQIADVVRFCEMHWAKTLEEILDNADFIEVVGEINTRIAGLYGLGINLHFGGYYWWDTREAHTELTESGKFTLPSINRRLWLVFSRESGRITKRSSSWETKANAFRRCHVRNHQRGVSLSELKQHVHQKTLVSGTDEELISSYEAYLRVLSNEPVVEGGKYLKGNH